MRALNCCYQSVKDKKFESNSQQRKQIIRWQLCCYQSVKDKKFESNSQHCVLIKPTKQSCYQSVKDKKFESNSQHLDDILSYETGCYQSVKDKKFESNSQLLSSPSLSDMAVISLSKIKNLKAIHNHFSALSTRCGYDSMTCRYAPIFYLA